MDPGLASLIGAAAVGAVTVPLVVWYRLRLARAGKKAALFSDQAEAARRILEAGPEGLFAWGLNGQESVCSASLAVLLDLPGGMRSSIAEVIGRFAGDDKAALEAAVIRLRREGQAFERILALAGGRRRLRVSGLRTSAADGRPLADVLWMRSVEEAGPSLETGVADLDAVRTLLEALPFPAWLRDGERNLVFRNEAAPPELPDESQAAAAHARGLPVTQQREGVLAGSRRRFEVTETPLPGWPAVLGVAVDLSATAPPAPPAQGANAGGADRAVLAGLPTAVAIYGADRRLAFFNPAFARLWHLDPGWLTAGPRLNEVLERLRSERRLPEVADFKAFRDQQMARFGSRSGPEDSLLHLPDGRAIRTTVTPQPDGGIVCSYEDVSERLHLERSLNELASVQRATLDRLYEAVAVFGADGRLKLSNPAFIRLWSLGESDAGEPLHLSGFVERLRPCFPDIADWPEAQARLVARFMRRETDTGRLFRPDGRVLDYACVPLPDGAVLLSYLDVSDAFRVEQALRDRAEALQAANRLNSEFIANVSYEVRTPLTTIVGFADLLAAGHFGKLNPRQLEYSQGILASAQGLMEVIGDILDLASVEAGLMTLELDTVDIHAVLAAVVALVRERARRKNLEVRFDCPTEIGWIVADEKRLKQIVFNLVVNAVNFTKPGGSVGISARRDGEHLNIAVSDTGIGVPAPDRERIFGAFERGVVGDIKPQGVGLGLTIVKRFVELHGGTVELRSAPNHGTTVNCRFPAALREDAANPRLARA